MKNERKNLLGVEALADCQAALDLAPNLIDSLLGNNRMIEFGKGFERFLFVGRDRVYSRSCMMRAGLTNTLIRD